jgi:hypothetical protein
MQFSSESARVHFDQKAGEAHVYAAKICMWQSYYDNLYLTINGMDQKIILQFLSRPFRVFVKLTKLKLIMRWGLYPLTSRRIFLDLKDTQKKVIYIKSIRERSRQCDDDSTLGCG